MRGAEEFAKLFETGQYGRLYLVSGARARGARFRVFVLPAGEPALPNGPHDAPLNRDAVEVDDIGGGQSYRAGAWGWLQLTDWRQEFAGLVEARCAAIDAQRNSCVAPVASRRTGHLMFDRDLQHHHDGNKRAAFLSVGLFLALNGYRLAATQAEASNAMLSLAAGELEEAEFAAWLRAHLVARKA